MSPHTSVVQLLLDLDALEYVEGMQCNRSHCVDGIETTPTGWHKPCVMCHDGEARIGERCPGFALHCVDGAPRLWEGAYVVRQRKVCVSCATVAVYRRPIDSLVERTR